VLLAGADVEAGEVAVAAGVDDVGIVGRAAIQPLSPPPTSYQSFSPIEPPSVRLAMHTVLLSCCEPQTL